MSQNTSCEDDAGAGGALDSESEGEEGESPQCFDQPWHHEQIRGADRVDHSWRVREKYKTHCVALVLCLNVSVDPPDIVKTQPCARLECWIDPNSMTPGKALDSIGTALEAQYKRWQPRARYKQLRDPTSDEVKKLCCTLRRNAKDERVLFHYNGHGVPKPSAQGEIWVFNRAYTQYIPLSMYDLQTWMGAPSLYVYDCSNAGVIVHNFKLFAEQHEREQEAAAAAAGPGAAPEPVSYRNCIQLAACAAGQNLPMNPELPADLFTACLTTPVKMAMKWFVLRNRTRSAQHDLLDLIEKMPGQVTDRRTMLGELNWIFTAITDTIAWSSLPPELFQQLFRADLLTASLCRNFLLADRIMRCYNCTPVASPALPSLAAHPLWAAWEQTLDLALAQLPALLAEREPLEYEHSPFFRDQLTAFEVWLDLGRWYEARAPPEQLPMVLQVLLSTLHRVRALQILCRFLALGAWAVHAVLAVGIFPYMLKLLQASAPDLRASMVYIWAKIIAVDPSCQVELVNANAHKYFLAVMQDPSVDGAHRTLAAYVLAGIVDGYRAGQDAALAGGMVAAGLEQALEPGGARAWACVALGRLWRGCAAARGAAARDLAHEKLSPLLTERAADVRAAAAFALGALVAAGAAGARSEHANALDQQVAAHLAARARLDASPLVRAEILAALQWMVLIFEQHFIAVHLQERITRSDRERRGGGGGSVEAGQEALARAPAQTLPTIGFGSVYTRLWSTVLWLRDEPHPLVARLAAELVGYIEGQAEGGREAERAGGWASLPPSPNTRPAPAPHAALTLPPRRRALDSTGDAPKKPIVSTQFVEWLSARMARADSAQAAEDVEGAAHHARSWRRARNGRLRRAARALAGRAPRLDAEAFHSRCPLPPAAVLFHPYDQHAAVASKDNFGVWDWGTGAKLCVGGWRRREWGRITGLAYLDAHRQALLAVASERGHVAVFRAAGGAQEAPLVTAWRALDVRPAPVYRPPPAQPIYSLPQFASAAGEERAAGRGADGGLAGAGAGWGAPPAVVARWSAARRSLCVGGAAGVLRLWDADAELLQAELATESEAAVTALWRGGADLPWLVVAGFADGAARAWDERAGAGPAAVVLRAHQHTAPLVCVARRGRALVSVCAEGWVRARDVRGGAGAAGALWAVRAPGPLAAADVHALADVVACGSLNQSISLYDLRGAALNTIKHHEGLLGPRIGPVSSLTFHPLRCAMGVGSKDSSVSVYVAGAEPRR